MRAKNQPVVFLFVSLQLFLSTALREDPLIRIDFRESNCDNEKMVNFGSLENFTLVRNASATNFSAGNLGLENHLLYDGAVPRLLHGPIKPLLSSLQDKGNLTSQGISISMWIRPLEQDGAGTPIITVGSAETQGGSADGITECDRRQIDLQLNFQQGSLTLLYRTSDHVFEPCQQIRFDDVLLQRNALTQIAVVLADRHQQIFVNGLPSFLMEEPFNPSLEHWDMSRELDFFSYRNKTSWHGRIYNFEVWETTWSEADIAAKLSLGLPPAIPCAFGASYSINEDAEIVPESHCAEWYKQPNNFTGQPDDAPKLLLPITFLDEDVEVLLESLGINHSSAPEVMVYISGFPTQGTLYSVDGTILSESGTSLSLVPFFSREIVFIPEHNAYSTMPGSTYATFDYCVALRPIFARSQCLSTATVNIVVDPVNDPPVAYIASEQPYVVHEGLVEEKFPLQLKGYDVDRGDSIIAFDIVTTPQLGYLFLSVPVRRSDGLVQGTPLLDMDNIIPGSEALVEYRFNNSGTIVGGKVVWDSFDFRVCDSRGTCSVPARVTIQVASAVVGKSPLEPIIVREDSNTTIPLWGQDRSGLNRSIGFFFESVPNERDASVLGFDDEVLQEGTLLNDVELRPPYDEEVGVGFQTTTKVCRGTMANNVSFGYMVVAFKGDGHDVSSVSGISEQKVVVECAIKPIGLAISPDHLTTRAFDFGRAMNDPCSGYVYNASETENRSCNSCAAIVDGIIVTSDDSHTERALVTIQTDNGRLTLNEEHRKRLRILKGQAVMRPSIEFLALPSELTDILAHLHFQSRVVGSDKIRISIRYGNHAGCREAEGDQNSFHCFYVQKTITVDVLPALHPKQDLLFDSFPWAPLPFTFTMLLLIKLKGKMRILLGTLKTKDTCHDDEITVADTTAIQWQQFYDDNTGFFYYQNLEDGSITWDPPLHEDFIAWEETEE